MSKKIRFRLVTVMLLAVVASAYADEYPVCRERCATDNAECLKSVASAPPEAKTVLEKGCQVEVDACSADCEEMRSIAGILRKVME